MGFNEGCIVLDSENSAYYAGQTINGRIEFEQGKDKNIHGIYVSFKGFCKVHWTTRESRRVNDRTEFYTVDHTSYEEYVNKKNFVVGHQDGSHNLHAGRHVFNFSFPVPANCPSTFEGEEGHIRYRVKAVMLTKGMFSSNKELFRPVNVVMPTDLNHNPYCKAPIELEIFQSYCCWCFNSGSSELKVRLPVGGYCPGQIIPIEVSCKNESSVEISEIKFTIKKDTRYIAESAPDEREEEEKVTQIKKGPIPGNTTRNWTVEMEVPAMDVYNLDACRFIDINYHFKVSTEVSGCHTDEDDCQPIIIGTIPLVGYQDNVQNPLHDQLPKQIQEVASYPQPILNQSYPNSMPYPTVNAPYPTPNISVGPTYPNTPINQPYPNPVSPYPAGNHNGSPYPPTNQPYPGNIPNQNTSPNPQINQGYPGAPNQNSSPYPPTNQPYPGNIPNQNTSPNPQINQGYPGAPNQNSSPYPPTNQPYPGNIPNQNTSPNPQINQGYPGAPNQNSSPYPPTNQPYPGNILNQNTSPYPQNNLGYPGTPNQNVSPYPQGNQPYPSVNPSYPGNSPAPPQLGRTQSPVPPSPNNRDVTSSNLVTSGMPGFAMPSGDGVATPLLPPGAHVPYPLRPASPYASASAPEPATPDSVDKKLVATSPAETSNDPPYNPDFVNKQ